MSNLPLNAECLQQPLADCYKTENLSEYGLREMSLESRSRLRSRFKGYPYKNCVCCLIRHLCQYNDRQTAGERSGLVLWVGAPASLANQVFVEKLI